MRTEELVEAIRRTEVPTSPDLDAITRRGRGLVRRRRTVGGGLVLLAAVAVATPFVALERGSEHSQPPAVGVPDGFGYASPIAAVEQTDSKFYWGSDRHSSSLGPEAIWVETGDAAYRISYGFRDERTGELRRAGEVAVPSVTGTDVDLPSIPHQHGEPTYVGMYRLPVGADPSRYSVVVETPPAREPIGATVRQSGRVYPGYLVFWVTGSSDVARGTYAVEDARGDWMVSGGFRPAVD